MAFCGKCGAAVAENAGFCGACGQSIGTKPAPANLTSGASGDIGMAENVAGVLCYVLGWVTGLVFFLIDKRPFVRFHAAQSMVVFGGLQIIYIVFGRIFLPGFSFGGVGFLSLYGMLFSLLQLAGLALWILLMVKAYQGERFKVPVAGDFAESLAKK